MTLSVGCADWTRGAKNGPAIMMLPGPSKPTRRRVVTGLAAVAALPSVRCAMAADEPPAIAVTQGPAGATFDPPFPKSFRPGDRLSLRISNTLAGPIALGVFGLDGASALQPLLDPLLEPGQTRLISRPLVTSGTFAFEASSIGNSAGTTRTIAAFTVAEAAPPQVDLDRIVLIEEMSSDGASSGAQAAYAVNGEPSFTIPLAGNERARIRLINGCQRKAIGLQFDAHDLRIIAIDSRPAEPFLARDRRIVLAPGSRVDALVDAMEATGTTSSIKLFDGGAPRQIGQLRYSDALALRSQPLPEPAPMADVPLRLELASALRVQFDLGAADGLTPTEFVVDRKSPLFRVKHGRTVLLTLANRAPLPATFRVYGHHFRWLDRLDDGWKPFLPDTMLIDAGQTERIAFRADFVGDWLIEIIPMNASAPTRVHWFAVE